MEETNSNITEADSVADNEADTGTGEVKENGSRTNFPTQAVLTIRAIVGGYVLYLAYQIITSDSEISPFMWAAVALFIIAGVALIVMSVKHFILGEYVGGKRDTDS